jgi:hypothetical protein
MGEVVKGELFDTIRTSLGTVRACRFCGHIERLAPGVGKGRGFGMREGNKARGRIIQHVKETHPEAYAKYLSKDRKT